MNDNVFIVWGEKVWEIVLTESDAVGVVLGAFRLPGNSLFYQNRPEADAALLTATKQHLNNVSNERLHLKKWLKDNS